MRFYAVATQVALLFWASTVASAAPGGRDRPPMAAPLQSPVPAPVLEEEQSVERAFAEDFGEAAEDRPSSDEPLPAAPIEEDPRVAARAAFQTAYGQAQALVSAGRLAEAVPAVEKLLPLAQRAGSEAQQRAFELVHRLAVARKDERGMERASENGLRMCGPARVESCRQKALTARAHRTLSPAARAAAQARVKAVQEQDRCVAQVEAAVRAGPALPSCFANALAFYQKGRDRLMATRLLLARAQAKAKESKTPEAALPLFSAAEKNCSEERCIDLRRRALKRMSQLYAQAGDRQRAARTALREMELGAVLLPRDAHRYARTQEVEMACAQLDAQAGAGSCQRLEKELLGHLSFRDFSSRGPKGEGLPPALVREVNAHFGVLMEECLNLEALRLLPPAYESYGVRWSIRNDGRVQQVKMDRKEQDAGPLAQCLREQFALWRYPRFTGEFQHVEQRFTVQAKQRPRPP